MDKFSGGFVPDETFMKDESFVSDAIIKMEVEIFQDDDGGASFGLLSEDGCFDSQVGNIKTDFFSGHGKEIFTSANEECLNPCVGSDEKLFRELGDSEVDYGHALDSYNDITYDDDMCVVIKKENIDSSEDVEDEDEYSDVKQKAPYERKTKKAKCFVCTVCNKTFTSEMRLKRHSVQVHPSGRKKKAARKEEKHFCKVCSKGFTSESRLQGHSVTHTGEKPYSCDICGQKFSHTANQRRHMKRHTGEKSFVCPFCERSFDTKSYLKDHMVKHTGEKPHTCKICSMTFAHRFSLKQHVHLKHPDGKVDNDVSEDNRPFSCEVCGKKYTHRSSLKIHIRQHTGSRPYKCNECDSSFTRNDLLVKHQKEHTSK